MSSVMRTKFWT